MALKANLKVHLYPIHTQAQICVSISVLENYGMQQCTANFLCVCLPVELLDLQVDIDATIVQVSD